MKKKIIIDRNYSEIDNQDYIILTTQTTQPKDYNSISKENESNPSSYNYSLQKNSDLSNSNLTLHRFKILVLGDKRVGKSTLIQSFVNDSIQEKIDKQLENLNMQFTTRNLKTIRIDKYNLVDLELLEIQRQELGSIPNNYYSYIKGVVLIYDVTEDKTFNSLDFWVSYIRSYLPIGVNILLVGNKEDMSFIREIEFEQAEIFAKKHSLDYMEISALENKNVSLVFYFLSRIILLASRNLYIDRGIQS